MPFGSGRKKGWEWKEVSEIEGDKNSVQCDHCSEKISGKIERVRIHLEKCKERKKDTDEQEPRPGSSMSNISLLSNESDTSISEGSIMSSSTPEKRFKSSNLNNFVVRTSNDQKDAIDKQVARFFFTLTCLLIQWKIVSFRNFALFFVLGMSHQAERNWVEIY